MAANLTSVVMQFLTPEVIAQIASFLGLDRAATQTTPGVGTVAKPAIDDLRAKLDALART